jgi:UDP-N-acetylmuramoyl-tripeptide--D-alanyl-D-alanine ligase
VSPLQRTSREVDRCGLTLEKRRCYNVLVHYILFVLIVIAGLSPLLTFARLWQVKEWRIDRLREHLRHEGWFKQLFGVVKPSVTALGLIVLIIGIIFDVKIGRFLLSDISLFFTVGLLAWFTLFRFVIFKQAHPVWTLKSFAVSAFAFVLFCTISFVAANYMDIALIAIIAIALPLFAFVFVGISLGVFYPLDHLMKIRILVRARNVREKCENLTVVGITGSVGKTTTKELLSHILKDREMLVTPAHVNTEMGVANLIIKKLKNKHQIFIVEMGAYRKGEIKLLCSLAKPQMGIITFIGRQHLGLFGNQEELCKAKGELFEALPAEGHAFLNTDSEHSAHLMERSSCPVHTISTGGHASYEAFDIQESSKGITFTLRDVHFEVPLQGTHQITNVLLAVTCAESLGVPIAESAKRLNDFHGMPQTFERKDGAQGQLVLDDTHNTSPASFRAAIEWAKLQKGSPKILVTEGLLELGKDEDLIHRELGLLSRDVFDEVVFLSKKCVRYFEQGFGSTVTRADKKKFKIALSEGMLIVCEGRMPESVVQRLLS